jgi:hypothetical protein
VLGDVDAELQEVPVHPRSTQQGIRRGHFPDEGAISTSTEGRPRVGRPESRAQYSRNRRRCQRRTVSAETMTSACRQPVHTLASATEEPISRVELRAAYPIGSD